MAKLRAVGAGTERPLLLRTQMGAGHGGPSGRYDAWRDEARILTFLLTTLCTEDFHKHFRACPHDSRP